MSPDNGPVTGGQTVTVNGTGFYKTLKFSQISHGDDGSDSTCGISAGKAYCWGANSGNGNATAQYSPVAVDTSGVLKGKTITQISIGDDYTIALASDGTAYSWGDNGYGQLGNGDTSGAAQYSPVAVDTSGVLAGKTITQISTSNDSIIALASDGTLYAWGGNWGGQLGNGNATAQYSPVAVDTSGVLKGKTITQISIGDDDTVALASDGTAYSWGYNGDGVLGSGDTSGANQCSPVAVDTNGVLKGKTITQVSADYDSTIALASDGTVYSWGYNGDGALGNGDTSGANQYSPVAVDTSGVLKGKTITQVSTSYDYTIALASDGTAYSWGDNGNGQLGNGDTSSTTQYSPVAVNTSGVLKGKTITQIATSGSTAANGSSTIALASDGTVYAWGYNGYGELGSGDTSGANQYSPVAVDTSGVLKGKTITQISIGDDYTIALASDGTAYAWGANWVGRLGNGNTTAQYSPVAVSGVPISLNVTLGGNSVNIFNETANSFQFTTPAHTAGLVDMSLSSDYGSSTLANAYDYVAPPVITNIVPNSGSSAGGDSVTIIGDNFNSNDTVTFGNYQAKIVNVSADQTTMTVITPASISAGTVDVTVTDQLSQQATDSAGFTYLDIPLTAASVNPNKGPASGGQIVTVNGTGFYQKLKLKFSQISQDNNGSGTACGISAGKAYCWGNNVGNGDTSGATQYSPVAVDTSGVLKGKTITQIVTSGSSTIALASDGTVYCWGYNGDGRLGNGDTSGATQYSPVAVDTSGVLKGKTITQISTGGYGTIALASDGTVYAWGANWSGQLGNGDTSGATQYSPVAVDTSGVLKGKTITQISTGGYGTIALASDGTAYGWGNNWSGELGNGDTSGATQYSPVAVDTSGVLKGKTITQIVTSGYGTIALASDGTVYAWGANWYGELGNGDTSGATQYSPVAVDTSGVLKGKTITQISTSYDDTIALASDGTAYGWGNNWSGQLGNGDTSGATQYSPVAVDTSGVLKGKTITQISTSSYGTIALASDGTAYGWGNNGYGQLGNGDTSGATQYSPVAVDTSGVLKGKTITQISTGGYGTIALASDGTVYAWGANWNGQLGNGDTSGATQYSPVAVTPMIASLLDINATLGGNNVDVYNETANSFQFITPAHTPSTVDLTISSPDYGSFTLAKSYTYVSSSDDDGDSVISITGITPNTGSNTGGNTAFITGSGLSSSDTVTFGGIPATITGAASDGSSITVIVPTSNTTGSVNVVIADPSGQQATLYNGFIYTSSYGSSSSNIIGNGDGYTEPSQAISSNPVLSNTSNADRSKRRVIHRRELNNNVSNSTNINIILPPFVKHILANKATPYVVPGIMLGAIVFMAILLIYQAYKEVKQARFLLAIIKKDRQTVEDKESFLSLASHYLRTPVTLISSAVDMLTTMGKGTNAALIASLMDVSSSLKTKIENILTNTKESKNLSSVEAEDIKVAKLKTFTSPIFWLPVILSIVLTILVNWAITKYGHQTLNGTLIINQVLMIVAGFILLYTGVRLLTMRRARKEALERSRAKILSLDQAKMDFINLTYHSLTNDILHMSGLNLAGITNEFLKNTLKEGTIRLSNLVSRFATLSSLAETAPRKDLIKLGQLIDQTMYDLSKELDTNTIKVNNLAYDMSLTNDRHLLGNVLKTVIGSMATKDNIVGSTNTATNTNTPATNTLLTINGTRDLKNKETHITINGPLTKDKPAENLFSVYSTSTNEQAGTATDDANLNRLDLYLDRMIVSRLGGDITATKSATGLNVDMGMKE